MKHDDVKTDNGDQATAPAADVSNVAENKENTMTALNTETTTTKRRAPPKASAKGKKVATKATKANGKTKKVAAKKKTVSRNGLSDKIRALLSKAGGATRAELLKLTGWPAINPAQFVPDNKKLIKVKNPGSHTSYKMR